MQVKKALVSVYEKEGIVDFARELGALDVTIYSTGGTLSLLRKNGLDAQSIETITETPELLSGRVKTLHPKIFAGLLAKRDDPDHMSQLREHGIPTIDLVACNLYPFKRVVEKKNVELSEALENIDIGGVTLIRAAAKNYKDVAVLVDPSQYREVSDSLKAGGGLDERMLWVLAREAFDHIVAYDEAISRFYRTFEHPAIHP